MQRAPLILYPNSGKYDARWLKRANCHCLPLYQHWNVKQALNHVHDSQTVDSA